MYHSGIELMGQKIFGSPYILPCWEWAFGLPDAERKAKWESIPTDVDILMTHNPPKNILDGFADFPLDHERRYGCQFLTDALKVIKPKLHVFGHVHEGYGSAEMDHGDSKSLLINASSNTLQYACKQLPAWVKVENGVYTLESMGEPLSVQADTPEHMKSH